MFFWRCSCGHAFYPDTLLQTDGITHSSLYTERTCSDTERFVHREAFTHRRFYPQRLSRKEFFTHRSFYTPMLYTKMFLHSAAFTHRWVTRTQTLYIQMLSRRSFYTEIPLHRAVFTQRSFSRLRKKANRYLNLDLFRFLSFPFQIVTANGWCWDIHVSLFVLWVPFQHSINDMTPMLGPLLPTDDVTHRRLYTEQPLRPNLHCCCLNSCPSFCLLFLITYLSCSPSQVCARLPVCITIGFMKSWYFPLCRWVSI